MAVQNIECQIATVLMKRFLDGDNLPQNLLDDLEQHLKVCPGCQTILNNEHADIEEVLDGAVEPVGVSAWVGKLAGRPVTAGGFATAGAGQALMQAGYRTYTPQAPGMAVLKNPKILFLSLALATVLIIMSTLLKNPTQLLGEKASSGSIYTEPKEEHKEEAAGHGEENDSHAAEEGHGDEQAHEDTTETDSHEGDGHGTETATDSHATENPEHKLVPDPRVPGEPTLDQSDLIVVGGKESSDNHKKEESTNHKTAASPQHNTPAKKPATTSSSGKRSSTPSTRRSTPKKSSGSKSSGGGGGIKVYDENGKPIH